MSRTFLIGLFVIISVSAFAQVRIQTGEIDYGIPIYEYENKKDRLSYNVSINYAGGNGIKVTDLASDIGLGWQLNAEARITRIKNEEPDDQLHIALANNINIPAGILTHMSPLTVAGLDQDPAQKLKWTPRTAGADVYFDSQVHKDRQRDVFVLSLNGRNIRFIIGNNREISCLENTNIKFLQPEEVNMTNEGIVTTIKSFEVIDESGLKYRFENKVLSEVLSYRKDPANYNALEKYVYDENITSGSLPLTNSGSASRYILNQTEIRNGFSTGYWTIDSWLLSQITNTLTNKTVKFIYNLQNISERRAGIDGSRIFAKALFGNTDPSAVINSNRSSLIVYEILSRTKYDRLNTIIFPDNKKVELTYLDNRKDANGRNSLYSISVIDNNKTIYMYKFEYFYTYLGVTTESSLIPTTANKDDVCLFLKKIQRFDNSGNSMPPILFEYVGNTPAQKLPKRFSLNRDIYNYPNEINSNIENNNTISLQNLSSYLNFYETNPQRSPSLNSEFLSIGMLKKIILQTGGYINYTYGINATDLNDPVCTLCPFGGVKVVEINKHENSSALPVNLKYQYNNSWGYENISQYFSVKGKSVQIKPADGPIFSGRYYNNYTNADKISTVAHELSSSGLAGDIKRLINTPQPAGSSLSTTMNHIMILYDMLKFFSIVTGVPLNKKSYREYKFDDVTNFINSPASANQFIPMYSKITVFSDGQNINGRVEYEYTDKSFFPFYSGFYPPSQQINGIYNPFANINYYGTPLMTSHIRFPSFAYGLPKSVKWFNSSNNLIKSVNYQYKNPVTTIQKNESQNFWSNKAEIVESLISPLDGVYKFESFRPNSAPVQQFVYGFYSGRIELENTSEKQYNTNGLFSEVKTEYQYHPINYLIKSIKTTNSKGEVLETKTYYPEDYTIPGVLQTMKAKNIITPVTTETWVTKSGTKQMLGTSVNEFAVIESGDIRVIKTYSLKSDGPVSFASDELNAAVLIRDPGVIKSNNEVKYDFNGNTSQVAVKGMVASTLYGYNNNLVIASIANGNANEVAYTSFENDANGNWTFPLASVTTEQGFRTGEYACKVLASNTVTSNIYMNESKKYTLSFWIKGTKPMFSGIAPWSAIPVITENLVLKKSINGWDYYEGDIQSNLPSKVVITASTGVACYIDELRLCPSNARMTTFTYLRGIGKSAETDANGRTVYYQYDDLGRMITVRDEYWNIIKVYEYNYKQ